MVKKEQQKRDLQNKLTSLKEFAHKIQMEQRINAMELMEQLVSTYPEQIWKCVDRGKMLFKANPTRDFFVSSALKQEPLTPNIWKNQFFTSLECPRPYLNFTVYKYHRKADELELIWCLPDRETLNFYYKHRHLASLQDYVLLKYCIEYKDGTLWKRMRELNGETEAKPSLIIHDHSIFKAPDAIA